MLQNDGMDWAKAEWTDAAVSMYREGVAAYLSKQIIKGLNESVYYSYNDDGRLKKRKSGFGYLAK